MGWLIFLYMGWIVWIFSLYFAFIPFRIFKKKGNVKKGENYCKTNVIVESGPYALIRHPQYFGGLLFSISITLWTQLPISLLMSTIIFILTYQWTYAEDKQLIQKFGSTYEDYKNKVPRLNIFLGIVKYFNRKSDIDRDLKAVEKNEGVESVK